MDLVIALDRLRKARRFVREGRKSMARQRNEVARLERRGYDPIDAILLLEFLEEMQARYESHQDQVASHVLALVKPENGD